MRRVHLQPQLQQLLLLWLVQRSRNRECNNKLKSNLNSSGSSFLLRRLRCCLLFSCCRWRVPLISLH